MLAAACGGGTSEPGGTNGGNTTPSAVAIVSGNGQTGLVGQPLSLPLTVKVTNSAGAAVKGASVTFAVTSGAASVAPTTAITDTTGTARAVVTLGATAGNVTITATVTGTSISTTFSATAGSGTVTLACTGSAPQTPAVGSVVALGSVSGVCLGGATGGADYALVAFNSNPDSTLAAASFTVTGSGTTALTTASVAPNFQSAPAEYNPFELRAASFSRQFDLKQRQSTVAELTPRIASARYAYRNHASRSIIPSTLTIGQMITLNANGNPPACSNPINVRARVTAISTHAIVVADSLNPTGGFTDAEYASFAAAFDTLVYDLDVNAFGQPSDIDKNGKILLLFTKEVNKLTPRGSVGFVGGFVYERDLFPTTSTPDIDGCATSNVGEMAYLLVPDPNGVFSDKRTKDDVLNNTVGTLAHEFQHLINAGRRLYVNTTAQFFETTWLNEGLSHIAEELLYYKVSGNSPRSNIGFSTIASSQKQIDAFNTYIGDNIGRYETFMAKPSQTAVYGDNDELETRGATWHMLRYLADHRGTTGDGDTWSRLENAVVEGHKNLANVFGSDYMTQIRNWSTSVFSDDAPGVTDPRYLEPSWNMRDIFPKLCANADCSVRLNKYPLTVVPLSAAAPANASVVAGGTAYIRFTVPSGGQSSIDWTSSGLPVSPLVQFTVVRTR
jgi:hypothetical protein